MARGFRIPLPVVRGGRHLGWVWGDGNGHASTFVPFTHGSLSLMPWSTYDQIINSLTDSNSIKRFSFIWWKPSDSPVASNWYDYWPCAGVPAAGTYPGSTRTARQCDDTTIGAMQHGGNVSPSEKYATRFTAMARTIPRTYILYDRVLTYEACEFSASNLTMTNSLTAQRYVSSGQPGLQLCMTGQTALNATTANLTNLEYTNQAGTTLRDLIYTPTIEHIVSAAAPTAQRPARVIAPGTSSSLCGRGPFLPLGAGDTGAQLVDNYTWSAAPTGTFCLALIFPLAYISAQAVLDQPGDIELLQGVYGNQKLTRIFDGACLSVMGLIGSATDSSVQGYVEVAWT